MSKHKMKIEIIGHYSTDDVWHNSSNAEDIAEETMEEIKNDPTTLPCILELCQDGSLEIKITPEKD